MSYKTKKKGTYFKNVSIVFSSPAAYKLILPCFATDYAIVKYSVKDPKVGRIGVSNVMRVAASSSFASFDRDFQLYIIRYTYIV